MPRPTRYLWLLILFFASCYARELDDLQKEHYHTLNRMHQLNRTLEDLRQNPGLQIDSLLRRERGDLRDTNLIRAYRRIYAQNTTNFWSLVALQRIEMLEYKLSRRQIIGRWRLEEPGDFSGTAAPPEKTLVFQDEENYRFEANGQLQYRGKYRLLRHATHQNILLQLEHRDQQLLIEFDPRFDRFHLGSMLAYEELQADYVRVR